MQRIRLGLLFACLIASVPARAEIGATGTRIQLPGGQPRPYMTYGHADEPELYAPLLADLRRLGITGIARGEDFDLLVAGRKLVTWPIVRFRQDVPETGEHPCVLVMGGSTYLPVRRIATLLALDINWEAGSGLMTLAVPPGRLKQATAPILEEPVSTLQGVTLEQIGGDIRIRIAAPLPIRPTWLTLKAPHRVVLDLAGAKWAPGLQMPGAAGAITEVRSGMFSPTTARLVLTIPTGALKLTELLVSTDSVTAVLGTKAPLQKVSVDPEAEKILAAIRSRRNAMTRLAARGGVEGLLPLLPFPFPQSGEVGPEGPVEMLPRQDLPVDLTTSLSGRIITVDAGHGGHDPGARGLLLNEKDLTLRMALELRRALEARGATVIMTRESDTFIPLEERSSFANQRQADLFISIHCNSTPRRNSGTGSETYWRTPQSHKLAASMHRRLTSAVARKDGGIRNRSFSVIRRSEMPSVLLEIGYINNTEEELLMASPEFQQKLSLSLVQGVIDYFASAE